jgi:hypothetical protein
MAVAVSAGVHRTAIGSKKTEQTLMASTVIVPDAGDANGHDQQMDQGLLSVKELWVNIRYLATETVS